MTCRGSENPDSRDPFDRLTARAPSGGIARDRRRDGPSAGNGRAPLRLRPDINNRRAAASTQRLAAASAQPFPTGNRAQGFLRKLVTGIGRARRSPPPVVLVSIETPVPPERRERIDGGRGGARVSPRVYARGVVPDRRRTVKLPTLTDLRNWAHSALAIVGFLSFVFGLVVLAVHTLDPSVQATFAPYMAIVGGVLVAASKLIDSVYAWMVAHATGGAVIPGITGTVIDVPPATATGGSVANV